MGLGPPTKFRAISNSPGEYSRKKHKHRSFPKLCALHLRFSLQNYKERLSETVTFEQARKADIRVHFSVGDPKERIISKHHENSVLNERGGANPLVISKLASRVVVVGFGAVAAVGRR